MDLVAPVGDFEESVAYRVGDGLTISTRNDLIENEAVAGQDVFFAIDNDRTVVDAYSFWMYIIGLLQFGEGNKAKNRARIGIDVSSPWYPTAWSRQRSREPGREAKCYLAADNS